MYEYDYNDEKFVFGSNTCSDNNYNEIFQIVIIIIIIIVIIIIIIIIIRIVCCKNIPMEH